MKTPTLRLALVLAVALGAAPAHATEAEDVAALVAGVDSIGVPGIPGPLTVFGPDAFVAVVGEAGGRPVPIVAATRFGKGRVVVLPHGGYFSKATLATADTGRLLLNAIRWAAKKPGTKDDPIRVAVEKNASLRAYLNLHGIKANPLAEVGDMRGYDVVVPETSRLSDFGVDLFRWDVKGGRGLVLANLGWGWRQLNPGKDLPTEMGANRLLAPMGIVWGDGYLTVPKNRRIKVAGVALSPNLHAGRALDALESKTPRDLALAVATLSRGVTDLPPDDAILLPRLEKLGAASSAGAVPSAKRPITDRSGLAKVLLALQIHQNRRRPVDAIAPHPAAAVFPGAVPKAAARIDRTIEIDTAVPGWHSTGLYAAPGEVVTVTVPAPAAGRGLEIRIGAHKDRLWTKKAWRRAPEITRSFRMKEPVTRAANAFGGLVYIDVPRGSKLGKVTVFVHGAVEAPLYVHGETDLEEWRKEIRHRPAPWAELATSKVILTVPSEFVRTLDDPKALMAFWDRVMDACADLSAMPHDRLRPERYVTDEQISAGYMHAGYPIMTHLDAAPRFVDLEHLSTKGDWGMFHEMGHNHQHRDWTFGGTTEVTCNLYSLYVMETVCEPAKFHQATSPASIARATVAFERGGKKFEDWKSKPFLALVMYIQLRKAFGWEAYKKVFAEYRDLPAAERPKNDAEKRDQWMVRFSRTVGRNLGPFFESWGVPTSKKARRSIADLPGWMPEK